MNRRTILTILVAVTVLTTVTPAKACSCRPDNDWRDRLAEADAAFIGTYISTRPHETTDEVVHTFQLDEAVKGEFGETVEVVSANNGAMCGIAFSESDQTGLLLYGNFAEWRSHLCAQLSPDELRKAAEDLPEPNGEGPPALLLGGSFGEARVMTLDSAGRTLGYGFGGNNTVLSVSVCPGGTASAELFANDNGLFVTTRRLPDLEVIREVFVSQVVGSSPTVFCSSTDGGRSWVFRKSFGRPSDLIYVPADEGVRPGVRTWHRGPAQWVAFSNHFAFFLDDRDILRISLHHLGRKRLATLPRNSSSPVVSPNGRWIAATAPRGFGEDRPKQSKLVLVNARNGRTKVKAMKTLDFHDVYWWGNRRVVFACGPGQARVFNLEFQQLGLTRSWCGATTEVAAGGLWAVGYYGELWRASLPDGQMEQLSQLPSQVIVDMERVPPPG